MYWDWSQNYKLRVILKVQRGQGEGARVTTSPGREAEGGEGRIS